MVHCCLHCTVWYAPKLGDQGLKLKASDMKKRDELWKQVKCLPLEKIDTPIPWYPETSGYEVCTIKNHVQMS